MHPTAMANGKMFFDTYVAERHGVRIIDIGAQDVNGSLRSVCPAGEGIQYVGVDFVKGKGVDVVLTDPYALPFEDESADVVVCSSCLEHSEMFWLVFNEILRILRPDGLLYLNVPSNGMFHRYPVDCWRFYPDSGGALVNWARRAGMNPALLESYVSMQRDDVWNDFVAVFVKDRAQAARYKRRITDTFANFENGMRYDDAAIHRAAMIPEDLRGLNNCWQALQTAQAALNALQERAIRAERELAKVSSGAAGSAPATSSPDIAVIHAVGGPSGSAALEKQCGCCGGMQFDFKPILWRELIDQWQLSQDEANYINRQQAEACSACGANLRSIALANAIRSCLGTTAFLDQIASAIPRDFRLFEINEAGMLSRILQQFPGYTFGAYPEFDMHAIPYNEATFDMVIHSDTLEHVENPVHALSECRRILKPGGALCYTVPIVVGRLTRNRRGLPKSFHGDPRLKAEDYVVHTEYGADAWTHLMCAGFTEVAIHAVAYPAAIAMVARK